MLQPRVLPKILQQANTGGIRTTLLLNADGSLLSSVGDTDNNKDKIISAIVSNIWRTYSKKGKRENNAFARVFDDDHDHDGDDEFGDDNDVAHDQYANEEELEEDETQPLECIIVEDECGRLAIKAVSHYENVILCCCADKSVQFGLLKAKVDALAEYLREPFEILGSASSDFND